MIISKSHSIHSTLQHLYIHLAPKPRGTLFFLHGGPGWSDAPWAGIICKNLWPDFNTVHWDQRGSNRSEPFSTNTTPLTIQQMQSDTLEACKILKTEYQIERPILIGHSWGAFLGALLVHEAPELFQAYIGIGQLVANAISEPISLRYCKEQAKIKNRTEFIEELNSMSETFYTSLPSLFREREILYELGGEFFKSVSLKEFENWMTQSPKEYQTKWERLYQSCEQGCGALWPELIQRNLLLEVPAIDIPVRLLQGRQDYVTAAAPVVDWFRQLTCLKSKELIWFEESGHWPHIEENHKFIEAIHSCL
jgi:pimeloyl-ACP methyl ester carboxylesterase